MVQRSNALVSSPWGAQILYAMRPKGGLRENEGGGGSSKSSYSSIENSAEDEDEGERVGDCTMSWRNEGSNGPGAKLNPVPEVSYIGCSEHRAKSACERDRGSIPPWPITDGAEKAAAG
jgi:hypothetical protein